MEHAGVSNSIHYVPVLNTFKLKSSGNMWTAGDFINRVKPSITQCHELILSTWLIQKHIDLDLTIPLIYTLPFV